MTRTERDTPSEKAEARPTAEQMERLWMIVAGTHDLAAIATADNLRRYIESMEARGDEAVEIETDHLRYRAERAEQRVARLREALDGVTHPDPEKRWRRPDARAALSTPPDTETRDDAEAQAFIDAAKGRDPAPPDTAPPEGAEGHVRPDPADTLREAAFEIDYCPDGYCPERCGESSRRPVVLLDDVFDALTDPTPTEQTHQEQGEARHIGDGGYAPDTPMPPRRRSRKPAPEQGEAPTAEQMERLREDAAHWDKPPYRQRAADLSAALDYIESMEARVHYDPFKPCPTCGVKPTLSKDDEPTIYDEARELRECVGMLRSFIRSGESLNAEDEAKIGRALSTSPDTETRDGEPPGVWDAMRLQINTEAAMQRLRDQAEEGGEDG